MQSSRGKQRQSSVGDSPAADTKASDPDGTDFGSDAETKVRAAVPIRLDAAAQD
jgi:hypothetical protein